MALSDTLLIRHLPVCLSKAEIKNFLKHIGATKVVVLESKVKKQTAFATFKSGQVANEALFRLHQKEIFDSRLVVEFAKNNDSYAEKETDKENEAKDDGAKGKLFETFIQNLNNWTIGNNFKLPPPHHLRYRYPSPTAVILLNIVNALSYSTKLYTQVLHLMNKMNLSCPLDSSYELQDNDIFNSFVIYILENSVYEGKEEEIKSDSTDKESELESDEEVKKISVPVKRHLPEKKPIKRKLVKPTPTGLSRTTKVSTVEEVFETVERETPAKKIKVKMPTEIAVAETTQVEAPVPETSEGFGVIYPTEKPEEKADDELKEDSEEKCITAEQLAMNRVSERDRKELPVFKNYVAGIPSRRLYIKNLAKDVTLSDLQFIFKRYYIKGIDEQGTMFDIRLMQEGRMKGQAFVALQNEKLAEKALKETNGYIIKTKPMVVQFARSEIAK